MNDTSVYGQSKVINLPASDSVTVKLRTPNDCKQFFLSDILIAHNVNDANMPHMMVKTIKIDDTSFAGDDGIPAAWFSPPTDGHSRRSPNFPRTLPPGQDIEIEVRNLTANPVSNLVIGMIGEKLFK